VTAISLLDDIFQEGLQSQALEIMAPVASSLVVFYSDSGQNDKVREIALPVIKMIEAQGKESDTFKIASGSNHYAIVCAYYGYALGAIGSFTDGEKYCAKAVQYATSRLASSLSEHMSGLFYRAYGKGQDTVEHAKKCIEYGEEENSIAVRGFGLMSFGSGYWFLGKHERAIEVLEEALRLHEKAGIEAAFAANAATLGFMYFESGDIPNARKYIEKALDLTNLNDASSFSGAIVKICSGRVLGSCDPENIDRYINMIRSGIKDLEELNNRSGIPLGYVMLGELYAEIGEREKALENLKIAEAKCVEMGIEYWLDRTQKALVKL